VAVEVLPAENTDEEEAGRHEPRHHDHDNHLINDRNNNYHLANYHDDE
jgi:hypothetical protein